MHQLSQLDVECKILKNNNYYDFTVAIIKRDCYYCLFLAIFNIWSQEMKQSPPVEMKMKNQKTRNQLKVKGK